MATATRNARKPRTKPERRVHLYNADGNPKLLEMTIGAESFSYWLESIPADFGIGFEVRKLLPEIDVYHVHYDPARRLTTCDCKGGEHHGHCKHQEAILALIQCGKLAVPLVASKPEPPAPRPQTADSRSEVCGFCSGRGFVYGNTHDAYGYQRHDEPPQVTCEYCGGSGQCADGGLLLPADEPRRPSNESSGSPIWA